MRTETSDLGAKSMSAVHQTQATELLNAYQECILRGEWPDIDDYVRRYQGPDPEDFRTELELAAVLLFAGCQDQKAQGIRTAERKHLKAISGSRVSFRRERSEQ